MDIPYDVPQDKGAQHVEVLVREFPVGGSSGWHTHPGVEIAYLIAGEMSLEQAGQPMRRLTAGDSFIVPRGVPHNGANLGAVPARLVITYVVDKDAPLRTAVPAP
jgi:quercetin dioxygenase-like cupin family protein